MKFSGKLSNPVIFILMIAAAFLLIFALILSGGIWWLFDGRFMYNTMYSHEFSKQGWEQISPGMSREQTEKLVGKGLAQHPEQNAGDLKVEYSGPVGHGDAFYYYMLEFDKNNNLIRKEQTSFD